MTQEQLIASETLAEIRDLGARVAMSDGAATLEDPRGLVGPKLRRRFARVASEISALVAEERRDTAPNLIRPDVMWRSDSGAVEMDYRQMGEVAQAVEAAHVVGKVPEGETWAQLLDRLGPDGFVAWCAQ
jgi:hypothetical protein